MGLPSHPLCHNALFILNRWLSLKELNNNRILPSKYHFQRFLIFCMATYLHLASFPFLFFLSLFLPSWRTSFVIFFCSMDLLMRSCFYFYISQCLYFTYAFDRDFHSTLKMFLHCWLTYTGFNKNLPSCLS